MDLSNVRIKEHFGIVTNDTKISQFNFLISPPKNRESIELQDVICLDHPMHGDSCQILAEVKDISSYEEVAGSTIGDRLGKKLAAAQIIGYVDLRNEKHQMCKLLVPPNPGSRVYMPYTKFLEDAFKRGVEGKSYTQPLYLGKAEIFAVSQDGNDEQIGFYLDAIDIVSKHMLISAVDGAGKTHATAVIIEELSNKTNHPIVIFDPNNEYCKLSIPENKILTITINSTNAKNSSELIINKIKQRQRRTTFATLDRRHARSKGGNSDATFR